MRTETLWIAMMTPETVISRLSEYHTELTAIAARFVGSHDGYYPAPGDSVRIRGIVTELRDLFSDIKWRSYSSDVVSLFNNGQAFMTDTPTLNCVKQLAQCVSSGIVQIEKNPASVPTSPMERATSRLDSYEVELREMQSKVTNNSWGYPQWASPNHLIRAGQILGELRDLFEDLFGGGNRYSSDTLKAQVENSTSGTLSPRCLVPAMNVVSAAKTRIRENPSSLKSTTPETDKALSPAQADTVELTSLPDEKKITIPWLFKNVAATTWITFIGSIIVAFTAGMQVAAHVPWVQDWLGMTVLHAVTKAATEQ
jgi:hypothetical protein